MNIFFCCLSEHAWRRRSQRTGTSFGNVGFSPAGVQVTFVSLNLFIKDHDQDLSNFRKPRHLNLLYRVSHFRTIKTDMAFHPERKMNLHWDLERSKGVHDSLKTTTRHEREPVGLPHTPLNSDKFLTFPICPQASQSSVEVRLFFSPLRPFSGEIGEKKVKRKGGIRQPKLPQSFHRTNTCYIEGRHLESIKVWTNSNGLPHNLGHKQECRQPGRQSVWCAKLQSCSIRVALP